MKRIVITLFAFWGVNFLTAQKGSIELKVNKDSVLMENVIKVEFIIKNAKGKFEGPDFKDFEIVMGPQTSSSYSSINGKSTSQISYTYFLKPKREGELFIENAYVTDATNDTNNLETSPLKIVAIPNPEGIIEEEENGNDFFQSFNFSWPNLGDTSIFKDEQEPKQEKPSQPKRKVKRI